MRKFLHSRNILSAENFDMVDWLSVKKMLINKPQQYQMWLTKHVSGFCGTNSVMQKRKTRFDSICPCCKLPGIKEYSRHQLVCNDQRRLEQWEEDVNKLDKWLYEYECKTNLHEIILEYVRERGRIPFGWDVNKEHELYPSIVTQNSIGWFNFMEGKMSKYIRKLQGTYLSYINSKISSERWMMLLIDQVIRFVHNQWTLCNEIVNTVMQDGLKVEEKVLLEQSIREELLCYNSNDVFPDEKHLYDHTFEEIWQWSGYQKQYWLRAVQTARKVKEVKREGKKRKCQKNISTKYMKRLRCQSELETGYDLCS